MAALDWSQCPAVESIPGKVSGAWVFKGTRLPADRRSVEVARTTELSALHDVHARVDEWDRVVVLAELIEMSVPGLEPLL